MRVSSLADFKLTARNTDRSRARDVSILSSEDAPALSLSQSSTVTEHYEEVYPSKYFDRVPSVDGASPRPGSFSATSSQTHTMTEPPWSPRSQFTVPSPSPTKSPAVVGWSPSPVRQPRMRINTPMTPPGEIPRWYAECFESSGESDTDTVPHSHDLRTSASPASSRIRSSLDDGKQRSSSSGLASQDGDTAVPPRHNASDSTLSTLDVVLPADSLSQDVSEASVHVWRPERWPDDVERLEAQWNPKALKFLSVSISIRNGAGCGCEYRCTAVSCLNARESRFCTERNCSFGAFCGNSLKEHPGLVIARSLRTGMRGRVASEDILEGEVIGQYLGHLQLFGPPSKNAPVNNGYRLHLKTRTSGSKHVGIDAFSKGSKLRFMNHSCDPAVRFHEVQTGSTVTVVAVTVRKVYKGEQVTVSYGEKLWFLCRCGWEGCQHRDITAGLEK